MSITRLLLFVALLGQMSAAEFQAGVAKIRITPEGPIWLSGYASRTHPSDGVLTDLWAKALALRDGKGQQAVIVTTDLIGLPRSITDVVSARLQKQYGLERSAVLFNSAHTHTGPVVRGNLQTMYQLDDENWRRIQDYTQKLTETLVAVAGAALADLKPSELSLGTGEAGFAANRREITPNGVILGVNPKGAVDHSVPVIRVTSADGTIRAILLGYACHNTTLTGEHYQISGDYAGYAQAQVEKAHPGAVALFLMLCGGDQNPNPRGTVEDAQQHGKELAAAVDRVLAAKMEKVRPPIRSAFTMTELTFQYNTRETFEKQLTDKNEYRVRNARAMLKTYDEGHPVRSIPYPVQAIRFGKDLTLVGLGGEVVVDYGLRIKHEYASRGRTVIVAGYCNDVMCYIPSRHMLGEGGYEPVESMIYYGMPGPFNDEVEETVMAGVKRTLARVGEKQ